jgi:hypothetical protein
MLAQNLEQIQTNAFSGARITTNTKITDIITLILPYVFWITGILLLIYLLMGGFQLMLAAGDPKKVQGAWGKITNAIIGFVIIFIAYWVTKLVGQIFNIAIINTIFK